MRGQIPHRPRYRMTRHPVQSHLYSRRSFFNRRWNYRQQANTYEKHPLGYGLSLIPCYRLAIR
jgi:hypothetical protein